MKKHLISTSAIALGVAAAAPASAQDWNLDWGGYMSQHVAWADVSDSTTVNDFDGVGFRSDAEIIFSPSVTLDNGMTFGVTVELEADNQSTSVNAAATSGTNSYIDEVYATISSDQMGQIIIGSENSAGYKSMVGAPTVTSMYINSPSISAFIPLSNAVPFNFRQAGISSATEVFGNNDVDRLTYFTPNFNGLVLGVSYARNDGGNAIGSHNNNTPANIEDIFDIGVNYSGSFGTTNVDIGARWGTASAINGSGDVETWGIGATVGFGGFTVGGSYSDNDNNAGGVSATVFDQEGWSLGATYQTTGPWAFEFVTYMGEVDGAGTGGANSEYNAYKIGASRELGPGVDWDIYAVYAEADDKGAAGTEVDGTVIGTAINLSF